MPMTISFVLAGVDDAEAILDLQRLAYQSEAELYGDFAIPPLLQTLAEMRQDVRTQTVVKGLRDGEIVASARAYEVNGTAYIGRVIVHPRTQGQGIGKLVMASIEAQFPNVRRFELFTGHASLRNLRFYRGLGYADFKTSVVTAALSFVYLEKMQSPRAAG
jgi:ribosomal protein S18 acetylase RimI-like enzyme